MTTWPKGQRAFGSGTAVLPNAGYARFLRFIAGVFLFVGLLALFERAWTLASDLHARRTWPIAEGEIVSATQQDDSSPSRRSGSLTNRTRYWVEYEVRFALPAERCRTGMIYEGPSEKMPCHGIVRTRSTQSSSETFAWFLHGYQIDQQVKVLWNPIGTTNTDIKIVDQSFWLRYNFARLLVSILWVLGSATCYVFCQRQLAYFANYPEEQDFEQESTVISKNADELTKLDLS
jgi:hypothetical protein